MNEKEKRAHDQLFAEPTAAGARLHEEQELPSTPERVEAERESSSVSEAEEVQEIRAHLNGQENAPVSSCLDLSRLNAAQRRVLEEVIDPARLFSEEPRHPSEGEPPWGEVGDFYETHKGTLGGKLKEVWAMLWDSEARRRRDLAKISAEFGFQRMYYPGSGADTVPRDALGADNVVHLSKEERYFEGKRESDERRGVHGDDMNVLGDFRSSPFKDGAFDAVLVKGIPVHYAFYGVDDFDRVLAPGGYIVLVRGDVLAGEVLADEIAKRFKPVKNFHGIEIYRKA